jgi:hypothetical protein
MNTYGKGTVKPIKGQHHRHPPLFDCHPAVDSKQLGLKPMPTEELRRLDNLVGLGPRLKGRLCGPTYSESENSNRPFQERV